MKSRTGGAWRRSIAKALALAVLAGGALALAACGDDGDASGSGDSGGKVTTIKSSIISPQIQPGVLEMYIGRELGYYKEFGLDTMVATPAGASDALQQVISGQLDTSISTLDALFAAKAQGVDLPLKGYYQLSFRSPYQIAVPPESEIREVEQLKGKKIGVVSTAETGYFYSRAVLRGKGMDPDNDVEFVALGQGPALLTALQQGKVDAIAAFRQLYAAFENQGYKVELLPQAGPEIADVGNVVMIARDDALEDPAKRKRLVDYSAALAKSTIFGIANPEVACRVHFKLYPQVLTPSKNYPANLKDCQNVWGVTAELYDPRQVGEDTWGAIDPAKWEAYAKLLGNDKVGDVNALIDPDLAGEAKDKIDEGAVESESKEYCQQDANKELCERSS